MSNKFQTSCKKPRSIRLSSSEDMSDYVTEFKNMVSFFLGHPVYPWSSQLRFDFERGVTELRSQSVLRADVTAQSGTNRV